MKPEEIRMNKNRRERSKPTGYCKICGQPEDEHHKFEPLVRPEGCICNPYYWIIKCQNQCRPLEIPPVCNESPSFPVCKVCGHSPACHKRWESNIIEEYLPEEDLADSVIVEHDFVVMSGGNLQSPK